MRMAFLALCLSMMAVLSACTDTYTPRPPQMTFENFQDVTLNVGRIDVKTNYQPPLKDPYVDHLFPIPPYMAAESLLKKKLMAMGGGNILNVYINDASVVKEELPVNRDVGDLLMREPAERLKAKVLVRFELVSETAPDIVLGHAEVIARRTKTLLEDTSVADRDQAYFSLTEDLMDDVNDGLRTVVKNTFGSR